MEPKMFCFQCQETAGNKGCMFGGVCGKKPETANLQDLLIYVTKGLSEITTRLRSEGKEIPAAIDRLITTNLFMTITNANFDDDRFIDRINETLSSRDELFEQLHDDTGLSDAASWQYRTAEERTLKADKVGVLDTGNEDLRSLRELTLYGLKGMAAYNKHANVLGYADTAIDAFLQKALAKTLDDSLSTDDLTSLVLETGSFGVKVMALLDTANTGVDVYTHSEMLPAHYYPAFKKYPHFAGNYGNAWWKQKEEFEAFNGPILLTTNCLVPPKESYKDRIYTTGSVGFSGCKHIDGEIGETKDFSAIIEHAKKCPPPTQLERGELVGGFAHHQVLALADKVVDAVKSGAIKKFVVMAGCDGRSPARNYYTDFAKALPQDTVILTAGCAKYKYNKLPLGDIGGIPRVLDAGQCNDSYSLALIALKLKEVFGLNDINQLPIVYNIAWYEQKAVIVLLALLSLGVKNIHLGPTLPAFLSPNVANVLIENFGIAGITDVDTDLEIFFGKN